VDPDRLPDLPRRARWLVLRMLLGGLIVMVLTGGAVATAGLLQIRSLATDFERYGHRAELGAGTVTRAEPGKPQTLLLVGSDRRYGDAARDARSDTLMLLRIDPKQSAVTVLSIPRDLAVEIPGHGEAKINEAYRLGGLDLTARTVKDLLSTPGRPFHIHHAVATTFGGFTDAVDHLGCVNVDVDRRYYHTNAGLPVSEHWSEIDLRAGYQRLCGEEALAYVRFRHLDNDIVRAARQQSFLREAKDQLRQRGVLDNLRPLVRIFARATETDGDLQSTRGLLRLAQLAIRSSDKPVRQIKLQVSFAGSPDDTSGLGSYVTTTRAQVKAAVQELLRPSPPRASARRATASRSRLVPALDRGSPLVRATRTRPATRMPILVPARLTARGRYPASTTLAPNPRRYVIGRRYAAYRLVIAEDASEGQFYGVQGTRWKNPPILDAPHETRRIDGREYQLYSDGGRLRLVAWRTPRAVYWVSNTLGLALSNAEMFGIARSATRVRPDRRK
jgi:polyisoprenyl-teichoic acid--peptidoglycan teichoic acid transferase